MKTYDYAAIRISCQEGAVSAIISGRRAKNGDCVWDDHSIDPYQAIIQYTNRCYEVCQRNPDMPFKDAEQIALCRWAAELEAAR